MNPDTHALSGAYVLDALDDHERAVFEEHLAACPSCRQDVAELSAAVVDLASAVAETPPPALRATTLAAAAAVRPLPPVVPRTQGDSPTVEADPPISLQRPAPRRHRFRVPLAIAAALLVIGGIAGLIARPWQHQTRTDLEQVLAAGDAERIVQRQDGFVATLVLSKEENRAVLVTEDMPAPPHGHVYQLWYERPDVGMEPAGVVSEQGDAALSGPLDDATAVGITVEPLGGSAAPTTAPMMLFAVT